MTPTSTTELRENFEHLARNAEQAFKSNPKGYKIRVLLLGLLGYAVIFGILLLVLVVVGGTLVSAAVSAALIILLLKSKLIIPLLILGWVLIKSLWVKMESPDGYRLTREAVPALFDEIDHLRGALATAPIHRVVLTEENNAAISQVPRLGILGPCQNTLLLGLPLLLSLSEDQARAVLAHEFGHLSSKHSSVNAWIYRVRAVWWRIMQAFAQTEGWSVGLLRRFFNWYAPYFSAYSFALARANEYEADTVSVQLTSGEAVATALIGVHLRALVADSAYWSELALQANDQPDPEPHVYTGLLGFFKEQQPDDEALRERLGPLLQAETDFTDTHPALRDRLSAIQQPPKLPEPVRQSAAETWFGDALPDILKQFDRAWSERNREAWQEHHARVEAGRKTLTELKAKPAQDRSDAECWQLAVLTQRLERETDPVPLYRAYGKRQPKDPDTDFAIAQVLLERGDQTGLDHLERAASHRPLTLNACNLAIGFLRSAGRGEEANPWLVRAEAHLDKERAAAAERATINRGDQFEAPYLPQEWLDHLAGQLRELKRVGEAWVARKQVEHFPEDPVLVLLFRPALLGSTKKLTAAMMANLKCPAPTFFVTQSDVGDVAALRIKSLGVRLI